jgi:catalase
LYSDYKIVMKTTRKLIFLASCYLMAHSENALAQGAVSKKTLTTETGAKVGDNQNSKTVGRSGATLLEDFHLIEKLAAFDRERIPERVVHARGAGAFGEFEVLQSMKAYTKAGVFAEKGTKTPVLVRFSTVIHGQGSPETLRDPRGFATKFYTAEGNYDLVGNNLPVFFIRDAMKFPDMVHALKPSPQTNKQDPNRYFDFFSHIPEATHMLTRLYSDYGTPMDYRHMNGSSVHAFKWINDKGEKVYVKYTWKTLQGEKNLTAEMAQKVQSMDFQHATVDLYQSIMRGEFPVWELYVQIMKPEQMDNLSYNPLDPTKIWEEKDFPLMLVGKMTLNKNPENYFEQIEQSAFSPAVVVPGIEPSEDKLLQGRLFSYSDTQRHRLGGNFQQIEVNKPKTQVHSNNQDGYFSQRHKNADVNYEPSRKSGTYQEDASAKPSETQLSNVSITQAKIEKTNDFEQAGIFYRNLSAVEKANLVKNLSADLKSLQDMEVVKIMLNYFEQADKDFGKALSMALSKK